jgi:DNA ligase-1
LKEFNVIHETLFKKDSTGRIRFWRLESNGTEYRTIAGLHPDGTPVVSGWSNCTGKQGRTDVEQCEAEVASKYKHQLDREYRRTIEELATVGQEFVEPMLAKSFTDFPGPGFSQPKLDGIRCIARAEGLFTRQGQEIKGAPHIHHALIPLFTADPDLILDGELYNHNFREDFGAISSIVRKQNPTAEQLAKSARLMEYHVYDVVDTSAVFSARMTRLAQLLETVDSSKIILVDTLVSDDKNEATIAYGNFVEAGYEGGMFRLDKPYEIGKRSKALLKRKEFITEEYPIVSIEEGNGNWAGAAKRLTLRLPDGRTFGAGIRGSYPQMVKLLKETIGPKSVATLRYFMLSPDGVPRFPVVIDTHLDGRKD